MFNRKKAQIEHICKNCKLYNPEAEHCQVVVMHEGQRLHIPVDPEDSCVFEGMYFDPTTKAMENFADDIKQVRFWVEDDKGEKTNGDGVVKIEYPEGFFAPSVDQLLQLDAAKADAARQAKAQTQKK